MNSSPYHVAGGGKADEDHDTVPEISGISFAVNLVIDVVENLLEEVEGLRLIVEVDSGVV